MWIYRNGYQYADGRFEGLINRSDSPKAKSDTTPAGGFGRICRVWQPLIRLGRDATVDRYPERDV